MSGNKYEAAEKTVRLLPSDAPRARYVNARLLSKLADSATLRAAADVALVAELKASVVK